MFKKVAIGLRNVGSASARAVPGLIRESAGLTAVGALSYGAWLIYPPAGFLTGGALVLAGVLLVPRT